MTIPANQSSYSNFDWVETLRKNNKLTIPENTKLKITDVNPQLCVDAKRFQTESDAIDTINYLFLSQIAPFDSKITIDSTQQPSLKISPEKHSYSLKTSSPLSITIKEVVLTIRAGETVKKMISGEIPPKIDFKANEVLLMMDIPSEQFKGPNKQISNLVAVLNTKTPPTHYIEMIANEKLIFVNLGTGWPAGTSIRSTTDFSIRLIRKEEYPPLHRNLSSPLTVLPEQLLPPTEAENTTLGT